MQNLIDISNHILCHSAIYCGYEEINDEMQEEAVGLLLRHGDFVKDFVKIYLDVQEEIRNECY